MGQYLLYKFSSAITAEDIFFFGHIACGTILAPPPGIEFASALVRSLNHWTSREIAEGQFLTARVLLRVGPLYLWVLHHVFNPIQVKNIKNENTSESSKSKS